MGVVHCIVTVHGMGEPRRNSTLLPVAERFTEMATKQVGDVLSLGRLSVFNGFRQPGEEGFQPAFQLCGVSSNKEEINLTVPFPVRTGEDLYFTDVFWTPILDEAYPEVGEELSTWSLALVNRLQRKSREMQAATKTSVLQDEEEPWWALDLMALLRRTITGAQTLLKLRAKGLNDVIFGQYLGDVQSYAESPWVRGAAARLFHEHMDTVHAQIVNSLLESGQPDTEIRYWVLAHSLGTVMALDSLMLAQMLHGKCAPAQVIPDGYRYNHRQNQTRTGSTMPDLKWVPFVKAWITLGSPVDKFLTLWWQNYDYMAHPEWIADKSHRIRHYNLCDEQDPVGHHLDILRTAPAFTKAFDSREEEDIVYNHTAMPGVAHVTYWKDRSLFRLLRSLCFGKSEEERSEAFANFNRFHKGVRTWSVALHFFVVPLLCMAVSHFMLTLTFEAKSLHWRAITLALFLFAIWFSRNLLVLNIWWRRLLKDKRIHRNEQKKAAGSNWWLRGSWYILALISWVLAFPAMVIMLERSGMGAKLLGMGAIALSFAGAALLALWLKWLGNPNPTGSEIKSHSFSKSGAGEWVLAALALLPTLYAVLVVFLPWEPARAVHAWLLQWFGPIGRWPIAFLALGLQLSAWTWLEVSYLHFLFKKRREPVAAKKNATEGDASTLRDARPRWQRDFVQLSSLDSQ